jgi:class 3 adenylate cyclase
VTSEAAAGETLMTESVAEQLRDANAIESVGARTLRGVERPVPLFAPVVMDRGGPRAEVLRLRAS